MSVTTGAAEGERVAADESGDGRRSGRGFRLAGQEADGQARDLTALILARLSASGDEAGAREQFVTSRFEARMASHLKRAPWLGYAHTALGVIAIGGGVATSTLAAGDAAGSTAIVVLGMLVATSAGLNQIFKFAKRSAVRFRAGNDLRREAWDFVLARGSYRGRSVDDAFAVFYDRIWAIEAPVDLSVELDDDPSR